MGVRDFKFMREPDPNWLRNEDVTIDPRRRVVLDEDAIEPVGEWWENQEIVDAINRQNEVRQVNEIIGDLNSRIGRLQTIIDEQQETIQRQASRIYPTQVQTIRTEIAVTEEQLEAMYLVSNETNDVHTILKRDLLNLMTQELLNSSFLDVTIRREEGFSSMVRARMDLKVQLPDSVIREIENN